MARARRMWLLGAFAVLALGEAAVSMATWPPPVGGAKPILAGAQIEPKLLAFLERACRD